MYEGRYKIGKAVSERKLALISGQLLTIPAEADGVQLAYVGDDIVIYYQRLNPDNSINSGICSQSFPSSFDQMIDNAFNMIGEKIKLKK